MGACYHTDAVKCDNCAPREFPFTYPVGPTTTTTFFPQMPPTEMQRIANALERIANALEKNPINPVDVLNEELKRFGKQTGIKRSKK